MTKKSVEEFKQEMIDKIMNREDEVKTIRVSSMEELQEVIGNISNLFKNHDEKPHFDAKFFDRLREEQDRYEKHKIEKFKVGDLVTQREGHGKRVGWPAVVVEILANRTPIFTGPEAINSNGFGCMPDTRILTIMDDGSVAMFWCEAFEIRYLTPEEILGELDDTCVGA